jgi:hypothetical protein
MPDISYSICSMQIDQLVDDIERGNTNDGAGSSNFALTKSEPGIASASTSFCCCSVLEGKCNVHLLSLPPKCSFSFPFSRFLPSHGHPLEQPAPKWSCRLLPNIHTSGSKALQIDHIRDMQQYRAGSCGLISNWELVKCRFLLDENQMHVQTSGQSVT